MTTEIEVPRVPDRRVPAGSSPTYVSPFGKLEQLHERLAKFRRRLCERGSGTFVGLGPIADLELVMRLISAREFVEWLRVNGDQEQARWAADILEEMDRGEDYGRLTDEIERVVPVAPGQEYGEAVEQAAALGERMRAVLVETGALADDDTATDPAALLRALLS